MKIKIASFAAALLIVGFLATGNAIASEDVLSKQGQVAVQQSGKTSQGTDALRNLALALSTGKEAIHPLSGSPSENQAGIKCHVNRIATYIPCYSDLIDSEEADTLFTRFIGELQAVLPSDRWKGIPKEPGISSVRSYSYEDQNSNAHIDIDIIAQLTPGGQYSYMVSIFAWPR